MTFYDKEKIYKLTIKSKFAYFLTNLIISVYIGYIINVIWSNVVV